MKVNKKFIFIFLVIVILIAFIVNYYIARKQQDLLNDAQFEAARTSQEVPDNIIIETPQVEEPSPQVDSINVKSERIVELEELQSSVNSDIIGLLEIENTDIDFPVLQTSDNSYYMNHNYKKQFSTNGAVFLDKDFSWSRPSDNFLIYGHNMKNNTMFQSLLNYKNKGYFEQHPFINFTTNSEDAIYEIFSVFESRVYYQSEKNVFRYYYFINAQNENEYNQFVANCKSASLYDTGKTAFYGEQLLTLSTCSYHTKDGRFAVVAKKAR